MLRSLLALRIVPLAAPAQAEESPLPFAVTPVAEFYAPWAMVFLPDGLLLLTE